MATIELTGISKAFAHNRLANQILHEISLTVDDGELVSIVGRSGCGKSTLLRIIAGFLGPDEGTVCLDGSPISGPGIERGMLFQQPLLFPWLTILQNTLVAPRARRKVTPKVIQRAREILRIVGLAGYEGHYPAQISGGMTHRAAFARAIMADPGVLLMDEPFASLDAITRVEMQQFLLTLQEQHNFTILFVTHDVEEAILLSNRVVAMSSQPGRIMEIVPIPLPYPRTYSMTETDEFGHLKGKLRLLVQGESAPRSLVNGSGTKALSQERAQSWSH